MKAHDLVRAVGSDRTCSVVVAPERPVRYSSADQHKAAAGTQIGGYLEWFGNRAWSAVTFAALTCRRRVCGRVAVNLVRGSFAGVLGALEAELAGDLLG
jgi:hypothetical protein